MHSSKSLGVGLFFRVILYLILTVPANSQQPPSELQKPEAVLQVGHRRAIRSVAFSPDGRWLASGAKDNTVKIWEVATGRLLRTLYGHGSAVNAVAASPDGKLLASGSGSTYDIRYAKLYFQGGQIGGPREDTSVRLWDVATGRQIRIFSGHTLAVMALAFSADGRTLTSASSDFIKVWDVASGKEVRSLAVFPPPASTFGDFVRRNSIMGASKDKQSDKWEKTFKQLAGEILISGRGDVVAAGQPGKNFRLFDTVRARKLDELDVTANPETPGALAFSRDGLLVAYIRNEKEIAVRSVSGGKDLWHSPLSSTHTSFLCFTPDGQAVVQESLEGKIRVIRRWSAAAGKPMGQASIADDRTSGAIAVSADGRFLVMLARGAHFLELREAATGQLVRTLGSSTAQPRESVDAELRKRLEGLGLRDAGELDEAAEDVEAFSSVYRGGEAVTFTLDGRWLLIKQGRAGGLSTVVWDTSTGTQLQGAPQQQFKNLGNPNQSPEGRFDIKPHYASEKPNGLRKTFDPSAAFSAGPNAQRIELRDARTGQKLHGFSEGFARELGTVPTAGFSLDGSRIAISGYKGRGYTPQVFIFDTTSGKKVAEFDHSEDAERGPVFALALSTDARLLAAGYETKDVEMIDAASGKVLTGIPHLGGTAALSFNPNGRLIALLGKDGDCYLLDAKSGQLLATLVSNENGDWLVVSPDGKFDGSPGGWNQILWRFSGNTFNVTPVETFFNEFYYPGLLSEIIAGKKLRQTRDFEQLDRRQPSVEISAEGASGAAVKNRSIKVHVSVAEAKPDKDHAEGSTVRDVRLFRNGSLVTTWHGEVELNAEGKATLELTIPIVAGPNRLTAYAFNGDNIKSPDASLVVTGSPALKRAGVAYIVSVGIDEYSNAQYNLKFAVADAEDVSAELKVQQSKVGTVGKVEVVSLLNAEATKKNVLLAVRRLAGTEVGALPSGAPPALEKLQPAQPEDEVFLYYAGHGAATDQRFFLIPYDLGYQGSRTGLDLAGWMSIMDHSISDLELEDALEKVDARDVILVIDACNSGQALEAEERRRGPMNSRGLAQLAYEKGMYVLTAAQGYQAALEVKELGHGLLTYALVEEGLKTAAADRAPKDGKTVAREWMDYATVRVPELQQAQMDAAQKQGRSISFVDDDHGARGEITQGLQRPRVFYRREPDPDPIVVAKP
jgi:WD40 repeat protein